MRDCLIRLKYRISHKRRKLIMKKTTKKYKAPSNKNTLFLRTLELTLIQSMCMSEDKLKYFRRSINNRILKLLKIYLEESSNNSNHKMLNLYQKHSVTLRLLNDEYLLSNQ